MKWKHKNYNNHNNNEYLFPFLQIDPPQTLHTAPLINLSDWKSAPVGMSGFCQRKTALTPAATLDSSHYFYIIYFEKKN